MHTLSSVFFSTLLLGSAIRKASAVPLNTTLPRDTTTMQTQQTTLILFEDWEEMMVLLHLTQKM
jgi:hypothetical protein